MYPKEKIHRGPDTEADFDSVSAALSSHLTYNLWRMKIWEEVPVFVKYIVSGRICGRNMKIFGALKSTTKLVKGLICLPV